MSSRKFSQLNFLTRKMMTSFTESARQKRVLPGAGFSLVEIIISVTIFAIIGLSIYSLIIQALRLVNENKFRMSAVTLADQKMEKIRNLPYADVGTLAGVVTGVIPDNETINVGNGPFEVNTLVLYEDDIFDGTEAAGTDMLPTDYKQVRIRVRYHGQFGQKDVVIYSKVAPRSLESSAGGGTLEVKVINASGQAVQGADVTIKNASTTPNVNFSAQTNAAGTLTLYGAKPSTENYEIIVTKAGYSTSSTTARTIINPNPTLVNQSVFIDQKTSITLPIDLVGTIRINTVTQSVPTNFKINSDTGTDDQATPKLAIDGNGNLLTVWQDFRNGSNGKIYAQKYDKDGQKLWPDDVVIGPANNSVLPDITVDAANNIYYSWYDDSNGNQDAFLVKYDPNGNPLWGGSKDVDNQAGNKDQIKPRISLNAASDKLVITWQDNRNIDADAFFKIYNAANRAEILTPEIRISTATVSDGTNQTLPLVGFDDSDHVYVIWVDDRNGNQDVYAQKYDLAGTRQWANDLRINSDSGSAIQAAPALTMSTSSAYVIWQDDRAGNQDIYLQHIDSNGSKLFANDILVNTDGGSSNQAAPSLAIDKSSNILYAAWVDERNGNQDVYAQKISGSDGSNLWSPDVRANINTGSSAQFSPSVSWNASENKPFAAWQDDRNGNFDIYATNFDQFGSATNLANIDIRLTGTKRIGENPIIYKYDRVHTSDSNGLITLNDMEYDSYNLSLSGITPYTIQLTQPATPIVLAPAATVDVTVILE